MRQLAADLADGTWQDRNAALLEIDACDLGYRLAVAGSAPPRWATSRPTA